MGTRLFNPPTQPKTTDVIQNGDVEIRAMRITPEMAADILDHVNTHNRPVNHHTLAKYTVEMREGRWHDLIGEPISFDKEGTLLNGQHRLMAIRDSGKTQTLTVLSGLETATQDAMDAGAIRQAGQQLALRGWKNAAKSAAVARVLLQWQRGALVSDVFRPSTEITVGFAEQHRDLMETAVTIGIKVRKTVPILPAVTGAAAFRAFTMAAEHPHRLTAEEVREFFSSLETGANLGTHHPILTLRTTAVRRAANKARGTTPRELFNVVRAWNAWRKEETLEKLQLPKGGVITAEHLVMI